MPERERASCEYCGRDIAVRSNGELYRHRMCTPTRVPSGPEAGMFQPWCPGKEPVEPYEELLEQLERLNPDALLLEPREHFDRAVVGITDAPKDHWPRKDSCYVAVYDYELCLDALVAQGMELGGAMEWFSFNTSGAWAGEGTPTFRYPEEPEE